LANEAANLKSRIKEEPQFSSMVDTGKTSLKNDLIIAKKKVERLSSRVEELEDITVDTRRSLTKEINKLKAELMASKDFQKELEDKCDHWQTEANNASNRISELREKLQQKEKEARKSSQLDSANTWEITQIRSFYDKELDVFRIKHRKVVKHLMDLQDTNEALLNTLTKRDNKLRQLSGRKDYGIFEVMNIEICAMREAFETKTKNLEKDLIVARANARRANQQLKDERESHLAAIKAKAK